MAISIDFLKSQKNFRELTELTPEIQNQDYEGYTFFMGDSTYRSRLAKLTPKKKGYFVAFWEKDEANKNQAYTFENSPEYIIVVILDKTKKGFFIFPKEILYKQKILKTKTQNGKMAIRVYPNWETDLNPTATKTQKWQQIYFTDLSTD